MIDNYEIVIDRYNVLQIISILLTQLDRSRD